MNMQDITKEQFETLILIRSLEELVTDEYEDFSSLSEAVGALGEGLAGTGEGQEWDRFVKDILKLNETGYIVSDATEESIKGMMPEVDGITQKGKSALEALEQEIKSDIAEGKKIVLFENFTLFNFDVSLLGGVESSLFKEAGALFKAIGKGLLKW